MKSKRKAAPSPLPAIRNGKRPILGCMEGSGQIIRDIVRPATPASAWEVLNRGEIVEAFAARPLKSV